jgi:hypothetical protein
MLKRAGWLARAVVVAAVVVGLGGVVRESIAQSDMKKDDKKAGDTMQSPDTMKSGDAMKKGETKGDMKAGT